MNLKIFETYNEMKAYIGEQCPSDTLFYSKDGYTTFSTNNIDGNFEVITEKRMQPNKPLKFTSKVDGYNLILGKKTGTNPHDVKLFYKIGEVGEWEEFDYHDEEIPMEKDEPVYIKGDNPDYFNDYDNQWIFACIKTETATEDAYVCVEGDIMSLRGEYIYKLEEGDFSFLFSAASPHAFTNLNLNGLNLDFEAIDKVGSGHYRNFINSSYVTIHGFPNLPKKVYRNTLNTFYAKVNFIQNYISVSLDSTEALGLQRLFLANTTIEKCHIQIPKLTERCLKGLFENATAITELTLNFNEVDWSGSETPFANLLKNVATTGVLYVPKEFVEESRIVSVLPATWTIKAIGEEEETEEN